MIPRFGTGIDGSDECRSRGCWILNAGEDGFSEEADELHLINLLPHRDTPGATLLG